jgi:hypothetical protein
VPGNLFVTDKEHTLIDSWSRELVQHVVAQELKYYPLDLDGSVVHELYREVIQKAWYAPVLLNARVRLTSESVKMSNGNMDTQYTLEVSCHNQELEERNLRPIEGDVVEYRNVFFEVTSVTNPDQPFGTPAHRLTRKLTCVPTREGYFSAGGDVQALVDNTTEPTLPSSTKLGD